MVRKRVFRPNNKNFERFLKEEAADIVKNNIPNYDYVSEFIQGFRKSTYWKLCIFSSRNIKNWHKYCKKSF